MIATGTNAMANELMNELQRRMDGALEALRREFGGLRTGRASAHLLDPIVVKAYGSDMPLNQVGTVNVPEPRMITVQVWDRGLVQAVERAIRDSNLGLNPQSDGQLVRIPIPELSQERRQELTKLAHKYAEQGRVAVRNVRRDGMDSLKKMEKDGKISQDEHRHQSEAVRRSVKGAAELGIEYLTLYGFSSENWKRPAAEVDDLMGLLRLYLINEIADLDRNGVRLRVIGQLSRLHPDIVHLIDEAERRTAGNRKLNLTVALSYGGRAEIADAARRIAEEVRAGRLEPGGVDETVFAHHLLTDGIPDPDLLIRTSGEKRISNFLLWQCAYAELVFLDRLWPDFTRDDLENAIREYHGRDRRYGA